MDSIRTSFNQHAFELWIVVLVLVIGLSVWVLLVQLQARRAEARLNALLTDTSEESVSRMLVEYLGTVRTTAGALARMKAEHDEIASVMPSVIRNVGLVRFSPFHDTGGDQSFALALLDSHGDGVVMTALHSRNDSRLYAKPIERGTSSYSLTPEEREAIDRSFKRSVTPSHSHAALRGH